MVRSPVKPATAFFFEVFAGLITCGTGSALYAAKDNLAAGIGLFTMVTMDTEVFRVIKRAFVIPVRQPMDSYSLEMVVGSLDRNLAISLKDVPLFNSFSI